MKQTKAVPKIKVKSKTKLKTELDRIFSLYIRLRDHFICCTCGKTGEEGMQCGHYIPRGNMNTRWDEDNCNAQCVGCNVFRKGNMDEYALFMVKKHGDGILEEMKKRKNTIRQWTNSEIEEQIKIYKEKVNKLINA
jgi:5-methylcytosine-specific restriction endonuclease McrA